RNTEVLSRLPVLPVAGCRLPVAGFSSRRAAISPPSTRLRRRRLPLRFPHVVRRFLRFPRVGTVAEDVAVLRDGVVVAELFQVGVAEGQVRGVAAAGGEGLVGVVDGVVVVVLLPGDVGEADQRFGAAELAPGDALVERTRPRPVGARAL